MDRITSITLTKHCLQFLLISLSSVKAFQKESCSTIETSLGALIKEFNFRHPMIYQESKFMEVKLLKDLNNIEQYSTSWQINSQNYQRNNPVLVVVKNNITNELELDIENMKKVLIIFSSKAAAFENFMDKLKVKIDQEVYAFQISLCEVYEKYEVNDVRMKQRLGHLQMSNKSNVEFVWEYGVQRRYN